MSKYAALFFAAIAFSGGVFAQLHYPSTVKGSQADDYFGTRVSDPYRWLENDRSDSVKKWVEAEQQFTENYLSAIPFRPAVKKRLETIINFPRYRSAFKAGNYIFYSKNNGLQNQYVIYYQEGLNGQPKVFIDPNIFSKDGTVSIVVDGPSNNKKYISYHINKNGSDWSTAYFVEIATNKKLSDSIEWMRGQPVSWVKNGFYYVRYPEPEKGTELTAVAHSPKVYYHELGQKQENDRFVYEDKSNPYLELSPTVTEDERFLVINKAPGSNGAELICKNLSLDQSDFKTLVPGYKHISSVVDDLDGKLLVNTNEGADRFRIVLIDPANPGMDHWKEIIPEKAEKLEEVSVAGGKLFLNYLKDASSKIYQYSYGGKLEKEISLPAIGTAYGFGGYKDDPYVFYNFTSFTYAPGIFRYSIAPGKSELFKTSDVKIDLAKYETEQVFYTSKDGTKVPMFIVHKKGIRADGSHPTLLYAYGGFDISITPSFSSGNFVLLENDGIFAIANIRGGGEYGEVWHRAGIMEKKQNVFDDFIAAAEFLIDKKYTSKERLAIMGGSNGGLLVGAVITQRPDLCEVAFPEVGVMDMLRFQKFTSGVFWTSEYGSSDSVNQFPFLYKYSPVHNIRAGIQYPATLVVTADHDDRVVPMHSFKFAAGLQDKQTGPNPALIRISVNQGHGASGSSLSKSIELSTDVYSFLFYNMGLTPKFE